MGRAQEAANARPNRHRARGLIGPATPWSKPWTLKRRKRYRKPKSRRKRYTAEHAAFCEVHARCGTVEFTAERISRSAATIICRVSSLERPIATRVSRD